MNRLLLILVLVLIPLVGQAEKALKVGDILLQPLDCWSCSLIEDEEDTIFSHIGIVLSVEPVMVAEARGKVRRLSLLDFNATTAKGQKVAILRLQNERAVAELQKKKAAFATLFKNEFEGLDYDHSFLWNNFAADGGQKLYCSEMVAKLLQAFLGIDPIIKKMHFTRNREQWERYFKGSVPDGKWGNSPGDFERSELFYQVGEL